MYIYIHKYNKKQKKIQKKIIFNKIKIVSTDRRIYL